MSGGIVREALLKVGGWGMRNRWNKAKALFGR